MRGECAGKMKDNSGRKGTEIRSEPMPVRGSLGTFLAQIWHKGSAYLVND